MHEPWFSQLQTSSVTLDDSESVMEGVVVGRDDTVVGGDDVVVGRRELQSAPSKHSHV